jgi:hypothetical protein
MRAGFRVLSNTHLRAAIDVREGKAFDGKKSFERPSGCGANRLCSKSRSRIEMSRLDSEGQCCSLLMALLIA